MLVDRRCYCRQFPCIGLLVFVWLMKLLLLVSVIFIITVCTADSDQTQNLHKIHLRVSDNALSSTPHHHSTNGGGPPISSDVDTLVSASQISPVAVTINEEENMPRIINVEYIFDPAVINLRGYEQVERVLEANTVVAGYYRDQANLIINLAAVHFPEQSLFNTSNAPQIINDMRLMRDADMLDIAPENMALYITAMPIQSIAGSHNGFASISGLCSTASNTVISDRVIPGAVGGPAIPPNAPLDPLYLAEIVAHESGHITGGTHGCGSNGIMAQFFGFTPRMLFSECSISQFESLINTSGGCVLNHQTVVAGFDGAWFDPDHDGEGFQIEILDDNRALVAWYTFDNIGNQRWLSGVGDIEGNRIIIDQLTIASGAVFGEGFNPADVVREVWGNAIITFSDCTNGFINYVEDATGTPGIQTLSRLTSLASVPCGTESTTGELVDFDVSGTWFDITHDGEGLVIEQLNASTLAFSWFSYDSNGNQAWFAGVARLQPDGSYLADQVNITSGGLFGPDFDPDQVVRQTWGSLTLIFTDCENALLTYASILPEYGSGTQNLTRLSTPTGITCQSVN